MDCEEKGLVCDDEERNRGRGPEVEGVPKHAAVEGEKASSSKMSLGDGAEDEKLGSVSSHKPFP